ncbi:MAG: ABC transporter substrate-binding protein [Lawsonibacter sp.]
MKSNSMKKILAAALSLTMTLSLCACSGNSTAGGNASSGSGNSEAGSGSSSEASGFKIAIVKQMDHPSLDEIANAITARLDEITQETGTPIAYEVYSGQDDETVLNQIGAQVIADGVSAIIPIATTATQLMTVAAEETKTPVIYAAVSDPAQADLLDIDYVTGTCDALNTAFILDMMLAQNPNTQKVGLLYSLSEPNSTTPIAEAKEYLDAKGIAYEEFTANSNDEVIAAAGALVAAGVDAVFTPTDNKIQSAELAIAPDFIEAGIPHYAGADSFVRNGAFATCGVNYTLLGTETADLAYNMLTDGMEGKEDYYLSQGGIITVNTETAAAMDLDYSMFSDMGQVVEVVTTED